MSSALPQLFALHQRHRGRRRLALLQHAPEPQRACEPERDLVCMSASFFLDQLIGGERAAELLAVEHVLAGAVPAELGPPPWCPRRCRSAHC